MAGFGTALTAGKWGLGLSMLAATVGGLRGEDAGAVDGTANNVLSADSLKWALSFFVDEDQLNDNKLLQAFDGNEHIVSGLLGSLLLLPGKSKWLGVLGAVAALGFTLYNADPENGLTAALNGASGATASTSADIALEQAQRRAAFLAGIDVNGLTSSETTLAQVDGQNLAFVPGGDVVDLGQSEEPENGPEGPEIVNE